MPKQLSLEFGSAAMPSPVIGDESAGELAGLLFIGDPHLASRPPGFRKDDYPRAILAKLTWALEYARNHRLLPVLLGDLFDFPRDNATWMVVELISLFARCHGGYIHAVHGNHDCKENQVGENDTLSVLLASGHVKLLDVHPWRGSINGCRIVLGGTSWNRKLPESFDRSALPAGGKSLVFWVTHHDLCFPGYEEQARLECRAIPGIDVVINGHIHRKLPDVQGGSTTWLNPGNISRVSRGDATRHHQPAVLRIDIEPDAAWRQQHVRVPFEPFENVFFPEVDSAEIQIDESMFIRELATLLSARTSSGAGLRAFLDANLAQFDARVTREINSLADEVLNAC